MYNLKAYVYAHELSRIPCHLHLTKVCKIFTSAGFEQIAQCEGVTHWVPWGARGWHGPGAGGHGSMLRWRRLDFRWGAGSGYKNRG